MKAGEEIFMDLIRTNVQFKVPIYQRLYDWKESHCQTLVDDIIQLLRNPEIPIHFMGSIVYIDEKGPERAVRTRELLLIDGQQRLTTFILILKILEELSKEENPELRDEIINTCLTNQYSKLDNKNKLILTRRDNEILEKLLRGENIDKLDSNISTNYKYLKNKFVSIKNEFSINEIYDGLYKIMVVDVGLSHNHDNPQQIFESLNATGKALSDADLIRNFILMNLESDVQERLYVSYWYEIEKLLESDLKDFLEDFTYMKKGISTNIKDLYKEFKLLFYKEYNNETENRFKNVEIFVEELLRYAEYYDIILYEQDPSKEINDALSNLNSLNYYSHIPLLLKIFDEYKKNNLSTEELVDIIYVIESFLFRRSICNIPTNSLNPIFRTIWKKIEGSEETLDSYDKISIRDNLISELKSGEWNKRWPDDDEFREKLIYNDLYHQRFDKHLLEELERISSKDSRKEFDNLTVEHILPQTSGDPEKLSETWKNMLGSDYIEIRNKWLHKLGNLTLTGYNPELSNKDFVTKKTMPDGFNESPLKLNLEISKYDKWDEESILNRSNKLAEMAINRWNFF
jgi:uncharacterized protein with ParB-like and HNH nuclease domain